MARPLVFQFGESAISFQMNKIDRSRLYGFKELEVLDDKNRQCELATLADDGRTLVGKGATALGWLDAEGAWCDKSELKPVDLDGNEVDSVESSFSAPVKLFDVASIDDYLRHNIRLIYALESEDNLDELKVELKKGTIFSFPYSYRGGLEADSGFLLTNESGEIMMAVGNPTKVEFIGLAAPPIDIEGEEEADEGELMDFDMI